MNARLGSVDRHRMRVILFRHGPAGHRDPARWPNDGERPLTSKGEERTRHAARGLTRLERGITRVLTSPLVRARLSADIVVAASSRVPAADALDALAPHGSIREIQKALAALALDDVVVLVGHEPDLGRLAGTMLFGAPAPLSIKKAGACAIDFEGAPRPGEGQLAWFLPPRVLRRLAGHGSKV